MLLAMRTVFLVLSAVAAVSAAAAGRQPAPTAVSAWVAVPAAGATATAAYVEVSNPTMYEIYVTGATTDAAASVELRGPAAGGAEPPAIPEFAVPAYGSTTAAASAPHLRLVGLTRPLKAGDTVQLTLTTDGGVKMSVAAAVRQP